MALTLELIPLIISDFNYGKNLVFELSSTLILILRFIH